MDILGYTEHDQDIAVLDDEAGRWDENKVFGNQFLNGNDVDVVFGPQVEFLDTFADESASGGRGASRP